MRESCEGLGIARIHWIQDWMGLNSEIGYLGLFRRRDAPLFVNGGKMRDIQARMCSTLTLKIPLTFYQKGW